MTKTFFLFGAGYSGRAFAAASPGTDRLCGTTRSEGKTAALSALGMEPYLFNGVLTPEIAATLRETTHLIVSIAPDDDGDRVLHAVRDMIAHRMPLLRWTGYLSTVGVYGDHHGDWVNESSACRPVSRRSVLRVEAENAWLAFGTEIGTPVAILRLSGIYGPGRNALVNLANGTARRLVKQGQVFNRIHVEDIAGALWHLANADKGGIFNITDDEPAPPQDVVSYAAGLMEMTAPAEIPFETAQLSPMARSFYGENKRVSNAAIKAQGYRFRYPDYRSAFDAMWAAGTWKGAGEDDAASPIRGG